MRANNNRKQDFYFSFIEETAKQSQQRALNDLKLFKQATRKYHIFYFFNIFLHMYALNSIPCSSASFDFKNFFICFTMGLNYSKKSRFHLNQIYKTVLNLVMVQRNI
ncbi:hypothetical protein BpHYR1_019000 [Brachionus plicatilis]|uniref:Uncharacterized protein n=1 Tax=Brachionus plicatilis TaxID=10195 RepID=A0A3M7RRI8_BRAPC|nr:hypothetical protein BpHYR1_019000 [Brachionus plicatilis]